MKSGTTDRVQGAVNEAKGKAKEVVGIVTNDPCLQAQGKAEEIVGKVQGKVGQIKQVVGK